MAIRGFQGRWLYSGRPGTELIRDGAVLFDACGRVLASGVRETLESSHPEARWSVHEGLLMPGLVNAHTHLELSALRGETRSGGGFVPWLRTMLAARERLHPEQDLEAIDAAVGQLLRVGTVAVGEVSNSLATLPALATAPILGRVFHEIFGLRAETAQAMRRAAEQRHAASEGRWPAQLSWVLSPHTVYGLHPEMAHALVQRARSTGQRVSLHLAEHAAERAFLSNGQGPFGEFLKERGADAPDWHAPGIGPVQFAARLGLLGSETILVHLADARPDDLALVVESGAPVVLCPRSNLFIELKLPPLNELLAAGIEPGLGTDSLASNTTLDVLAEASALADRFPGVPAARLLTMATHNGARALGLAHRVGALQEGLTPGLLCLPCPADAPDPARHVLRYHSAAREVLVRPPVPSPGGDLEQPHR